MNLPRSYWACISYLDSKGRKQFLSTNSPSKTFEEAWNQIDLWRDGYKFDIQNAWIDIYSHDEKIASVDMIGRRGNVSND